MRSFFCIVLAAVVYMFSAAQATAKVHWLPDFLKDNNDRIDSRKEEGTPLGVKDKLSCPDNCTTYTKEVDAQVCVIVPVAGVGNCYCDCKYSCMDLESVHTCQHGCDTESTRCPGKCEKCREPCDTELYPHSSNNCSVDMLGGAFCIDSEYHYKKCYCQNEEEVTCGDAQECVEYCDPNNTMCTRCSDPQDCGEGLHWNNDLGCVVDECPGGYAISTSSCGTPKDNASWELGTEANGKIGNNMCYQCISSCNSGYYDWCVLKEERKCINLGFTETTCKAGQKSISCPFDINQKACYCEYGSIDWCGLRDLYSCEELGYKETSCASGEIYISCPFNASKKVCRRIKN